MTTFPARLSDGPVGPHATVDPDQQVARCPVAQPPRARLQAWTRRRLPPTVASPGTSRAISCPACARTAATSPYPRPSACSRATRSPYRVLRHAGHPRHVNDQVAPRRRGAPVQARPAAAHDDGQLVLGRGPHDGRRLVGRPRRRHEGTVRLIAVAHVTAGGGERLPDHRSLSCHSDLRESAALVRNPIKRSPRRSPRPKGEARPGGDLGPRRTAAGWGRSCPGCRATRGRRRSGRAAWCPGPRR